MQPHIQATINDLVAKIARLQDLIQFLRQLGEEPVAPAAAAAEPASASASTSASGSAPRRTKAPPRSPSGKGSGGNRKAMMFVNLAKIAHLPEPFGITQVATALGVSCKAGRSSIHRWKNRGYLKSDAQGQFSRTAKFPANGAAHPAPAAPARQTRPASHAALDEKTRSDLDRQLADALKQRDHARSNGRDSIVEMFQKDIDRLEALLAGE